MERRVLVRLIASCGFGLLACGGRCDRGGASSSSSPPPQSQQAPRISASQTSVSVPTGGTASVTLTVTGTPEPNVGCAVNGAGTVQLSGWVVTYTAPNQVTAGGQTTTVCTATNTAGSATASVMVKIFASMSQITTSSLPAGLIGSNYHAALSASGGTSPYSWSISLGSLPPGLSLSTVGSISGTPTTAGSYNFATTVADSSGQTATANFTISVGNSSGQNTTAVPNSFFGVSVFNGGTFPLPGGIAPGTLGKVGGIVAGWLEPTCDGGTNQGSSCYSWSALDNWVATAQVNGLTLVYDFGIPGWMCGNPGYGTGCTTLPANLTPLTNFATTLATRYKGRIKYYETGNEVNNAPFWTDTCSNLVMAHNTIYAAIKAADPTAIVGAPNMAAYNGTFGGEGACVSSSVATGNIASIWLSNFLATQDGNGHYPTVDTVGVHTYAAQVYTSLDGCSYSTNKLHCAAAPLLHLYNSFRTVMTNNGMTSVPLLVTEGGFGVDDNSGAPPYGCSDNANDLTACLTGAQQVAYVGRWLVLSASTWADGSGQLANWYAYDINWGTLNGTYGMNSQNASAYGQMESWIKGAVFQQPCHSGTPATVFVCDFVNGQGQQSEIIFNDNNGTTAGYTTPSWAVTYQPLLGSSSSISGGTITVGDTPILLSP